jgi:hypothetical protein
MAPMPMRQDCKHFESRTYPNGETVRKCDLDLARYQKRLADVTWSYGTLVTPPTPDEPEGEGIAELLDSAEDIVNAAGPDIMADLETEQRRRRGVLGRIRSRFRRR